MIYLLCSANISDINSRSWQCVTTFHRVDQDLSVDRSDRLVGQTCVEFPVILISSFTVISGSITPLTRRIIFYPPWLALGSTHGHDWEEILWIHSIRTFHIQPAVKLLIFSWFEVTLDRSPPAWWSLGKAIITMSLLVFPLLLSLTRQIATSGCLCIWYALYAVHFIRLLSSRQRRAFHSAASHCLSQLLTMANEKPSLGLESDEHR